MKRITTLSLVLLAFAVLSLDDVQAQAFKRIQFAKGKSSAVVKGTTARYGAHFVLRGKSGQMLVLDVTPAAGIGIKVETVGRFGEMVLLREEAGGRYEIGLEETGDYTIFIGPIGNNPVTFTMKVQVRKLADV